jgi:hypothetical protein
MSIRRFPFVRYPRAFTPLKPDPPFNYTMFMRFRSILVDLGLIPATPTNIVSPSRTLRDTPSVSDMVTGNVGRIVSLAQNISTTKDHFFLCTSMDPGQGKLEFRWKEEPTSSEHSTVIEFPGFTKVILCPDSPGFVILAISQTGVISTALNFAIVDLYELWVINRGAWALTVWLVGKPAT